MSKYTKEDIGLVVDIDGKNMRIVADDGRRKGSYCESSCAHREMSCAYIGCTFGHFHFEEVTMNKSDLQSSLDKLKADFEKNAADLQAQIDKAEPELFHGYAMDQWQTIIDGRFLCEFWDGGDKHKSIGRLRGLVVGGSEPFDFGRKIKFELCRPTQIKGVMRPIFVEPVDKKAVCHFFKGNNYIGVAEWFYAENIRKRSDRYIEL